MQTYYFVSAKKRDTAPIYVRLSLGRKEPAMKLIDKETGLMECKVCGEKRIAERKPKSKLFIRGSYQCINGCDPDPGEKNLIVKSGEQVNPSRWSNKTQTIKQRILTDADNKLIKKLAELKEVINTEFGNEYAERTKERLLSVIEQFHTKKVVNAKTLNDYINQFIKEARKGDIKNKKQNNYAKGTVSVYKGFKRIFDEYQGIYTERREKEIKKENEILKEEKKPLIEIRPVKLLDFNSINKKFYKSFYSFLSDDIGYEKNTIGRFIKTLKYIMKKALEEGKHNNRDFETFTVVSEDSYSIALSQEELDKIYNFDLSKPEQKRMELARDSFIILCETCLRISDYKNITMTEIEGKRFIQVRQQKTKRNVYLPITPRFMEIWKKYNEGLPYIPEQYINKYIKPIAMWCGINQVEQWPKIVKGLEVNKTAKRWELVSCHTGRRSGATILKRDGVPIDDIRILLGHSTIKQTMEYLKIKPEEDILRIAEHEHFVKLRAV